jgi:hypothetical protein
MGNVLRLYLFCGKLQTERGDGCCKVTVVVIPSPTCGGYRHCDITARMACLAASMASPSRRLCPCRRGFRFGPNFLPRLGYNTRLEGVWIL